MAPSKVFNIKEKVYLPRDEQDQVDHLNFDYQSQVMSISQYCKDNFYLPSRFAGGLSAEQVKAIEEEDERLLRENEEENKRMAAQRSVRETEERKTREEEYLQEQLAVEKKEKEIRMKAEAVIVKEMERCKTFITKERLLEAIEDALANPVSYDFAIDKRGNVYTDGKIHPNAFSPSAVPDNSTNVMLEDKGDIYLKANRIFIRKTFSRTDSV